MNLVKAGGPLALMLATSLMVSHPAAAEEFHHSPVRCITANPAPQGAAAPKPFLKLPFRKRDGYRSLIVSNGWIHPPDEEVFIGPGHHNSLDFEFTRQKDHGYGLPVLAAAAGRAYFTYQNLTQDWIDSKGVKHRIGVGGGLVVEVRHNNGFVTQYIHLSKVARGIPYLPPTASPDVHGDWTPSGLFKSNEELWEFGVPVRAGQVLGRQGDTGMGLDWNDDFDVRTGKVAPRNRAKLPPWDPTQLHFQVYQGRLNGTKQNILDPSGGYWKIGESYNPYTPKPGTFCLGPQSLWLTDRHGQPRYAGR